MPWRWIEADRRVSTALLPLLPLCLALFPLCLGRDRGMGIFRQSDEWLKFIGKLRGL